MSEFKKKEQYHFWHSPLVLFILFCILVVFAYNVVGIYQKERETNNKKSLVLDQISDLNKRADSLTGDINKLDTQSGIEDTIRAKYQVVKEGEKMVTIVDQDDSNNVSQQSNAADHGFWKWIKGLFKKN